MLVAVAVTLIVTGHVVDADSAARPNMIVIMADDLGYGDLSCYGGWIKTPHLDALAAGGMRFTDFHSSGNVCSPTRAGLMTGRYQQRAGIPGVVYADPKRPAHYHGLHADEVTFAERLGASGYATAIFGKWHLGYFPKYNPIHQGFDTYRGFVSGNVDYFSHVDQAGNFDWWQQDQLRDEDGYTTHLITQHAVRFIRAHRDRPFCLYLAHAAPHSPYQGPGDRAERSVAKEFKTQGSRPDIRNAYREMVVEMDRGVGEVMAALRELDLERQTLVWFFSDNGANRHGSNAPLRGNKGSNWEGGHRVPCVAHWPGRIPAESVCHALSITLDVMPTLLGVAGVDGPADRRLDGTDLGPLLRGETRELERTLFWNGKAMRDGRWKLILDGRGGDPVGLYDLSSDVGERHNLAERRPERVSAMMSALDAWRKEVSGGDAKQPIEEGRRRAQRAREK